MRSVDFGFGEIHLWVRILELLNHVQLLLFVGGRLSELLGEIATR
jgi:hypothetical protein